MESKAARWAFLIVVTGTIGWFAPVVVTIPLCFAIGIVLSYWINDGV